MPPAAPLPAFSAGAPNSRPGGLAPAVRSGERTAVRAYYRGPRGDEF